MFTSQIQEILTVRIQVILKYCRFMKKYRKATDIEYERKELDII